MMHFHPEGCSKMRKKTMMMKMMRRMKRRRKTDFS